MASAFGKDIARSISSSLGRFLAIAGIVALGCGFYAGLRMTGPDMRLAGDAFYDGTHLYDIQLLCDMGYTQEQLDAVRSTQGVKAACASKSTDVMAMFGEDQYTVRVKSFDAKAAERSSCEDGVNVESDDDSYLNRLVLAQGRWPSKAGECVISADRVMGVPVQPGDVVEVLYGSQDLDGVLEVRKFEVTGLVHSSSYVSSTSLGSTTLGSGSIEQFAYVTEDNFDEDFPYTEIFVQVEGAENELSGGPAYRELVDTVANRLEKQGSSLAQSRLDQVKEEAQGELDDARDEYDEKKADAETQLSDARQELDDAAEQLESGRSEYADGQQQYEEGAAQLETARQQADAQLSDAYAQLLDAQAKIEEGRSQLQAAQAQLDAKKAEYEAGLSQWQAAQGEWESGYAQASDGLSQATAALDAINAQLEQLPADDPAREQLQMQADELAAQVEGLQATVASLEASKTQLDETKAQLDEAGAQIAAGQAQLDAQAGQLEAAEAEYEAGLAEYERQGADAQAQLDAAQQQLDDSAEQLQQAGADLEDGQEKLDEGEAEYERQRTDAEDQLSDAQQQIDDAQADIDALELPEIYVLDRTKNYGAESYRSDSERIDNIAAVFPFIFFLVAALVALTTMTRMVDEERVLIGTYKALGYSRARITWKYASYALAASLSGALVGVVALSQVLPTVISKAYAIIYNVPPIPFPLPIDLPLSLLSIGMGVGITLLATGAAAAATLREQPASLMLPRAPKPGKRILLQRVKPLWSRLSFSWKVTCRNLFRYKRRFWMTVTGIAGCTALLLTGLGLHDAIWDIIDRQYGPVVQYNVVIDLKADAESEDVDEAVAFIGHSDAIESTTMACNENMQIASESHDATDITVTVPRDINAFSQLVTFKHRVGQDPVQMGNSSVILTEKMAGTLGVQPGDYVTIYEQDEIGNATGEGYRLQVTDVVEYYVGHGLFMGRSAWANSVGTEPEFNSMYGICTEDEQEREAVTAQLHDLEAVETVAYNDETIDTYRKMLSSVNMIVVVLVVAAAGLAAIVLYNLTNINITERYREIASLKVLGFTPHEVSSYIFRETMLLTIIGAAIGLLFGYFLEGFVVVTAEVDYVMFGRVIHVASYVLAYVLTLVFSILIMATMRGKLTSIDMVESLKSIE